MRPRTPPMTLFVVLRSRRVDMSTFPSFMQDREREGGEEADGDRRLRRELGDRHGECRDRDDAIEERRDDVLTEVGGRREDRGPYPARDDATDDGRADRDSQRARRRPRLTRGQSGDRGGVEAWNDLVRLEPQRTAQASFVDEIALVHGRACSAAR